jgi:putative spermidine/putrescine transport system permease protein
VNAAVSERRRRLRPLALGRGLPPLLLVPSGLFILMFVAAIVLLATYSLHPYSATGIVPIWTLETWRHFLTSTFYWSVMWETVRLALIVTAIATLLAYPTAWVLLHIRSRTLSVVSYIVLFSPLLVSVVVRSYGWLLLLGHRGMVNSVLVHLPFVHAPLTLVFNFTGVAIALVHILLPFAVFPMLSVMRQLPPNLREAAADLGAPPWQVFLRVLLPLSLPGVVAGAQIVFTLAVSAWVTTVLLGGGRVLVLAKLVYDNISNLNWPLGAAESVALLVIALIALGIFGSVSRGIHAAREA